MSESLRKTFKEKLRPAPAQERVLEEVLWRCRDLYNAALEHRITAWQRRRVSISRYEQEAELKGIRAEFPGYASIHSHILQDVLARLDKAYQAFFRRVQRGEKAGFPRFKGRYGNRFRSFLMGDPPRRQFRRSWRVQVHPFARTRYLALYAMDKQTEAGRAAFLARVDRAMRAF